MTDVISCVMLTTTRRSRLRSAALAALAAQQGAPAFELVVVTDDDDPMTPPEFAVASKASNVILYRRTDWSCLAEKRNAACRLAAGRWITIWDDDDWSSPWRLLTLQRMAQTDAEIAGNATIFWHELVGPMRNTVRYTSPTHAYVVGGTLAFKKDLWHEVEFTDRKGDEGWWTVDALRAGARLGITNQPYVAMVHGDNIANKAPFRVNPATHEVHNGAEYTWLGAREVALEHMGKEALERFEAAVA